MNNVCHLIGAFLLFFAWSAVGASGPQPGGVDPSFDLGSGINGPVKFTIPQTNGQIVIGGDFTLVNGAVRPGLARLNADGTTDFAFMNAFSGIQTGLGSFGLYSIALQLDGKLLIGGRFIGVNGISRTNLARLNPDGTLDSSFGNGLAGPDSDVDAIIVQSDGKVLIGGAFVTVNGATNRCAARLNANGSLDSGFHPNIGGIDVVAIGLQSDGKILMGGDFGLVAGVGRPGFARLNGNGTLDSGFSLSGVPLPPPGVVIGRFAIAADGRIFIAGSFQFSDTDIAHLLRLNGNGSLDPTFDHTKVRAGVLGAVQPDGKVITVGNCARYNTDGSEDTTFALALATSAGVNFGVDVVAPLPDGSVILSGQMISFTNGIIRHGIARINPDGTLDAGFENHPGGIASSFSFSPRDVDLLALQPDGKALISGDFDYLDGVARYGIARLNTNGSLDASFQNGMAGIQRYLNVNSGLEPGRVGVALVQLDGKILVGGRFDSVNGASRTNLARLNPNGSLDPTFNPAVNGIRDPYNLETGQVDAIALQADGKVIICGLFSRVNGATRSCVARLNANGTLDTTFQNGMQGAYNSVGQYLEEITGVAVQPDGKVLLAGAFDIMNGVGRTNLARLNANGSLDTAFHPAFESPYGPAYLSPLLVLQPDGKILIGGGFQAANGIARTNLVRLNGDGSLDASFINSIASANQVTALASQPGGKILVGSYARTNFSRLNSDGSLDAGFACGLRAASPYTGYSVYATVKAILAQTNGSVFISGRFDMVGAAVRPGLARLFGRIPPPWVSSIGITANQYGFNITGYSNQIVVVEGSADLRSWLPLTTNTLGSGPVSFSDPGSAGFPSRSYRLRLQ